MLRAQLYSFPTIQHITSIVKFEARYMYAVSINGFFYNKKYSA